MDYNIVTMTKYIFSFLLIFPLLNQGCSPEEQHKLIGAKIYEHNGSYKSLFEQWNDMGINTGFCSQELISDKEFMNEARDHNISTFVIFPVFFNAEVLAKSPDLSAINRNGEAAAEEWVEFVCPSREDYRHQMVENARRFVRDHQPDGISIDFIRHFVYWEKVYADRDPASLPVSCFDSVCLNHFQTETGISIPDELSGIPEKADWILNEHEEAWTTWRCQLITSMAEDIALAAREEKPDILVNIHLVPWAKEDFNGAIQKVAGQDIKALSEFSDYLSPMTYAHMVKQAPAWVHHIVEDIYMQTGGTILPSIQVGKAYLETEFDLEEFRQTLEAALEAPSSGVIIWSWERLNAEPEKVDLFKDIVIAR
jgi:hypothetical protein